MDILCRLGSHDWHARQTARPGVTVYRCQRCDAFIRTDKGRKRRKKRHYLLGAALASLFMWYVIIALGLTGHTKVLWGVEHATHGADRAVKKVDHKIRKMEGAPV